MPVIRKTTDNRLVKEVGPGETSHISNQALITDINEINNKLRGFYSNNFQPYNKVIDYDFHIDRDVYTEGPIEIAEGYDVTIADGVSWEVVRNNQDLHFDLEEVEEDVDVLNTRKDFDLFTKIIDYDYHIPHDRHAVTTGPIRVEAGHVVSVHESSTWSVVSNNRDLEQMHHALEDKHDQDINDILTNENFDEYNRIIDFNYTINKDQTETVGPVKITKDYVIKVEPGAVWAIPDNNQGLDRKVKNFDKFLDPPHFMLFDQVIDYDYTVPFNKNAFTVGPVDIKGTVDVEPGGTWTVV